MIDNDKFSFQAIGIIHFPPTKNYQKSPIQPVFCEGIEVKVILDAQNIEGLKDFDNSPHIYLFFYFNESHKTCLQVKPYLSDKKLGIFATRAPIK